ncbi:MAG: NAD(P)H-hydrate dehydratase [Alphaproteobacteria bacterium]|nr:NAD(P)H-hydrate dehydratase [Alphaproteobacteria bacterium]
MRIFGPKRQQAVSDNSPSLWRHALPCPKRDDYKYSRGTVLVRGGAVMTGAARLAARAAQRMGAGLVTLAVPETARSIYAQAMESVIVRPADTTVEWRSILGTGRPAAALIGPGLGAGDGTKADVLAALERRLPTVVDADGLTAFADDPSKLLKALHGGCVLTPHEGEFARLFGISKDDKIARAKVAARWAGCVVLLKGADTVIATPDGKVRVNRHTTPWLATAGSGDVLAGMIAGLMAQGMVPFDAASAAAWMHGDAALRVGAGLIAEDLVAEIPSILKQFF